MTEIPNHFEPKQEVANVLSEFRKRKINPLDNPFIRKLVIGLIIDNEAYENSTVITEEEVEQLLNLSQGEKLIQ